MFLLYASIVHLSLRRLAGAYFSKTKKPINRTPAKNGICNLLFPDLDNNLIFNRGSRSNILSEKGWFVMHDTLTKYIFLTNRSYIEAFFL